MTTVSVRIDGLEDMQRRLASAPNLYDYALKIVLKRAGLRVRRESREIMPGVIFDRSIVDQRGATPLQRVVGTNAFAGKSIAEGRPAGTAPSLKATKRWVKTYGLAGAMSVKTRRQVGKKSVNQSDVNSLARLIRREIRARGTKPIPFLQGAIGPAMADLRRYMNEAVDAALKKIAR